ncbi:hypothetical protein J6X09_01865 [Candidatus Saccharibacteria bacterium]|nr:hypothetical protein [Candidatus Saccharibacteria bacterium]
MDIKLIVSNDPNKWASLGPVRFAEKIKEIEEICCRWVAFYSIFEPSIAYGVGLKILDGENELYSSHIMTEEDFHNRIEQHVKPLDLSFRFVWGVKIDHPHECGSVHMYAVKVEAEVYRKKETRNKKDLDLMQNKLKDSLKDSLGKFLM